jgi:threonine/homoserine/homoserine lactone efflux protein
MNLRILGIVLLVVGALLLYFGYQKTGAVTERAKQSITGDYTDRTMFYLIAGAAAGIAGVAMIVLNPKS